MTTGKPPQLWAGVECSLARIGDSRYDQFVATGHLDRGVADIERLANLGTKAVRYPVAWERVAPDGDLSRADWNFTDRQLTALRDRGVDVVAGLVHHGSGPVGHTSLLDDGFAPKLARFARAAAERYPWVRDWTPVNEPLTTARFSALYGVWHPHHRDETSFAHVFINQIRGIVSAMRAIREVIPGAKLMQTEDLGRTYATRHMGYQADFENTRRWLTWDLLCGYVRDDRHRMWGHLQWAGIGTDTLREFADAPCPPDLLGVDHYLTSERFLDERRDRYPAHTWGNNGCDDYADVEAVRTLAGGLRGGLATVLREAWNRYRIPLAVAEVHLGVDNEAEQVRWLADVWQTVRDVQARAGVDIRGVTLWAALGALDWNSLMTRHDGVYERGIWDIRNPDADGNPRETLLAGFARALARTGDVDPAHPALSGEPGWWQCEDRRVIYPRIERHELADSTPDALLPVRKPNRFATVPERGARVPVGASQNGR